MQMAISKPRRGLGGNHPCGTRVSESRPSAVRQDFSVGSGPVVVLHCGALADCCRVEGRLFNRRLSTGQPQLRMETRPPCPEIAVPSAQGCFVASVA